MAFQCLKRGYKKEKGRLFSRVCRDRTKENGFKIKERKFRSDIRKKFYNKNVEALEQITQRGGRSPVPGDIQNQAGWDSEQPDLSIDVPVHCREVELGDF